ncbi:PsiF family protein [Winslowiella iniecta]|uniref:Phosphate starvation-inducible protein n=1 Tax=Winslowiella iniecta TaxID=1560201 RepID=A0A0L7TEX0_9GAMM|nr:PsiF family protein [Winslowiella iniecta]KOC89529.1 phosphate starvation-inducible protein [Winslowiella iniecta]KOC93917.1 phosphate starvation-inducible protein [Winslowiella iniecta]
MKVQVMMLTMACLMASGYVGAAEKTPQQQKMTLCNQHASSQALKGDARKSFMSECLSKDSKISGMTPQQIRMKSCNAQAGEKALKGDERKIFMSGCLKKS